MYKSDSIRKNFFSFFTENPRNHKVIPNVSLVPVNDPTILFTNSGMFPLVPYLLGQEHPQGKRLCNFQRSLRTGTDDIEEIGDNRHTLMFEMMGNWSLGDYFKEKQIPWIFELYTKVFELDPKKLFVSVFAGDENAPRDEESIQLWKEQFNAAGINAQVGPDTPFGKKKYGPGEFIDLDSNIKIFPYAKDANWWQRGEAPGEPGGPDSEIFFDTGVPHDKEFGEFCHVNCDCGRFIEIGNNVFMQYKLTDDLKWEELSQKNIDFGGGFERVVMVNAGKLDIFQTDLFEPIINVIEQMSGKIYLDEATSEEEKRNIRIIADHIRGCTFILADGVIPANKDQGYILRSLIRRMIRKGKKLGIDNNFTVELAKVVIARYSDIYPHLSENVKTIYDELEKEELKFAKTIERGLKELQKYTGMGLKIDGESAFFIYETYGFPLEMILDEIGHTLAVTEKEELIKAFNNKKKQHQEQSRLGAEKKFKGGLADHSKQTTMLHTAHHLLLASLQEVLGNHVKQRGSNITSERLRIDFSHNEKLTKEQLTELEQIVNQKIKAGLPVVKKTMPRANAEKIGAQMEFGKKYGDLVDVYFIGDPDTSTPFSIEFCGGPHVTNTKDLLEMGHFHIIKEESSSAGIRRIKATLQ